MRESTFYQEIKAEGRKESGRAHTITMLEERFGAEASSQVADAVNSVDDPDELDRLHRLAIKCAGIDEFRAALTTATGQPSQRPTTRRRTSRPSRR